MASQQFMDRGGTEAEYRLYRALYGTGRKEPEDFIFDATGRLGASFVVFVPSVGLKVVNALSESGTDVINTASSGLDIKLIQESEALAGADRAVREAVGG